MQENELLVKNTEPPSGENSIENEIASIAAELDQIEDTFTSELNVLKEKIGHEYDGYAQFAMNIGETMYNMSVMSGNKSANKLAYGAAAAALVIQGIGTYKKNKAHNEYLDKLLEVKKSIAEGRILAMETTLPRLERSLMNSERMLVRFSEIEVPTDISSDGEKIHFKADQGMRILTLYKTASFFTKLGNYILSEAQAWRDGKHTSHAKLPGYSNVYEDLNDLLFVAHDKTMTEEFINVTSEDRGEIYGRDLLLVSDPQGVAYNMHNLDYAYIHPEDTPLGRLLAENPAVEQYNENVGEIAEAISTMNHNPQFLTKEACIWSGAGLLVISFFLQTSIVVKLITAILYLIVVWTIRFDFNYRLRQLFYYDAAEPLLEGNSVIKNEAGFVEQPERNFKKRKMFEGIFD